MKNHRSIDRIIGLTALSAAAMVIPAHADTLRFNTFPAGTVINSQYLSSNGVTISADNFSSNSFNIATLFDAAGTTGGDADLRGPYALGTYKNRSTGGNIL